MFLKNKDFLSALCTSLVKKGLVFNV